MSLGYIATCSLSFKMIIAMKLFKSVAEDMSGLLLRIQISWITLAISSKLTKVTYLSKEIHVALLLYLSLKVPLTTPIFTY